MVNSTGDGNDAITGDGVCETAKNNHQCTLRAAIEEANAQPTADTIVFEIPMSDPGFSNGGWTINLGTALPDLSTDLDIEGPGADMLTVQGASNTSTTFRIFKVTAAGTVTFSGITISHGTVEPSGAGGGILNANGATINVTDCILASNVAINGGGAISNNTGIVNLSGSTLSNNMTVSDGPAIANGSGTINAANCVFAGNNASDYSSRGGISNGTGAINIISCTLSGNSAGQGGGIASTGSGVVTVINSTLSGNTAIQGGGGAIAGFSGTINLSNCTIAGNTAVNSPNGGAGGVWNAGSSTINVKSTMIASNTATGFSVTPDVAGTLTSQGFNLIGKNDGAVTSFPVGNPNAKNDIVGTGASPVDPKLDPGGLKNNGGSTQTIALLFGSPAIDKGTSNSLTGNLATDQRGSGFPRRFNDPAIPNATGGDDTDIGAFEVQTAATPTPTPTPPPTSTPTPTPNPNPTATPTTLANISTRLRVETGDNVLIGGFIVAGTQPKKIIVLAIGPSLPFPDKLLNPTLELYQGNTLLDSNDDWQQSANKQAIIDSGVAPTNDLESAIVATLPANNSQYTAIVRGVSSGTGIGVVQAYDLDRSVDSKLANISTRGLVQTGDDVLIAGTIVVGQAPQKVLVEALGPSLSVPGKLDDPILELRDVNGTLLDSNDNWVDSPNKQAIIDSTIPPSSDFESAIIATLPAGGAQYTAVVRGVNNAVGVGVVEVFALQ
jgi:CSLREA domain-containing protein